MVKITHLLNRDLFKGHNLRDVLRDREQEMYREIDDISEDRLLTTSIDEWCDYFEDQYKVQVPRLNTEAVTVQKRNVRVPKYVAGMRQVSGPQSHADAMELTFFVPFDGDSDVFNYEPSTHTLVHPRAGIQGNKIFVIHTEESHDAKAVKAKLARDLSEVGKWLGWASDEITPFNTSIRTKARPRIDARRVKILKDRDLLEALGVPLERRDDVPLTYAVPTVRKEVPISSPPSSSAPPKPEPSLDSKEYEHILSVISNMVLVMEKSPQAFREMGEEDLRTHFLVQLNGQYKGQATGETFNFKGKTDILIGSEGKNIFVAECKFWDGSESLRGALDQLLSYSAWRDTKIALLVFNRRKDFSAVLEKIPSVIKEHPNFKWELPFESETGFRFVIHHSNDKNRDLTLTVLAFDIPV